jgi:hypothetical protein
MSGSEALRHTALEAIRTGKLPNESPKGTWGGPGSGVCCPICDERVKPDQFEFELEFATDDGKKRETYHLHRECLSAWESERLKLQLSRGGATIAIPLAGTDRETKLAVDEREAPLDRGSS